MRLLPAVRPHLLNALAALTVVIMTACASPATTIVPFKANASPIKGIAIVLEPFAFVPSGGGVAALDSEGWSSGTLDRKFCDGLVSRLKAEGVDAACVRSSWHTGPTTNLADPTASRFTHTLSIRPNLLRFAVETKYGAVTRPGFNPMLETTANVIEEGHSDVVWSGKVIASFAPVDPSGSRRFSDSLIDVLKGAGAFAKRS